LPWPLSGTLQLPLIATAAVTTSDSAIAAASVAAASTISFFHVCSTNDEDQKQAEKITQGKPFIGPNIAT
jgi:hypothetical protein